MYICMYTYICILRFLALIKHVFFYHKVLTEQLSNSLMSFGWYPSITSMIAHWTISFVAIMAPVKILNWEYVQYDAIVSLDRKIKIYSMPKFKFEFGFANTTGLIDPYVIKDQYLLHQEMPQRTVWISLNRRSVDQHLLQMIHLWNIDWYSKQHTLEMTAEMRSFNAHYRVYNAYV